MKFIISYTAGQYGSVKNFVKKVADEFDLSKNVEGLYRQGVNPVFFINNKNVEMYSFAEYGQNRKVEIIYDRNGEAYSANLAITNLFAEVETDIETAAKFVKELYESLYGELTEDDGYRYWVANLGFSKDDFCIDF